MMGTEASLIRPVSAISLHELLSAAQFYCHVDRVLDLAFVRNLVHDCYTSHFHFGQIAPQINQVHITA
jgi:hypothetical protein